MRSIEIKGWRKDATLKAIVDATFPDYRRTTISIRADESVTLQDLNWSGGSRSEYRACTLAGVSAGSTARYAQCHPWSNPAEGATLPVPVGMVVVRGGFFCGKTSQLTLHVNPADMPKYLTQQDAA